MKVTTSSPSRQSIEIMRRTVLCAQSSGRGLLVKNGWELIKLLKNPPVGSPWHVIECGDPVVIDSMPIDSRTNILFRKFAQPSGDTQELDDRLARLRVRASDPYLLARFNILDQRYCKKYPNATYWRHGERGWCRMTFAVTPDHGPTVSIVRDGISVWSPGFWIAAVAE